MEIIDFEVIREKKAEREQIKRLLMEGKTPLESYIEAQEKVIDAQDELIDCLWELLTMLEDELDEYEELIESQNQLIEVLKDDE